MTDDITLTTQQTQPTPDTQLPTEPTAPDTQPEPIADNSKTFTQADVDRILKERLDREKANAAKAADRAKQEAERKALEEQQKYQELYEKEKAEREKALAEMTALQIQNLRREVAATLNIPPGLASRLQGTTQDEIEADAKQLLASLPKAPVPSLDGRAGGGKAGKPDVDEQQIREQAAMLGVSYELLKQQYGA